jgi:FAD:protein FMN transferase
MITISKYWFTVVVAIFILFTGCNDRSQEHKIQFAGQAQGTYYIITYFANDTLANQHEMDSLLNDFDQIASIYQNNSLISRINRNETYEVTDHYFNEIFKLARRISEETNGAFDVTVGPLVNAWGFGFKNRMEMNQQKVDSLLVFVGYQGIRLENHKIIKDHPNTQIDFNAIAKGYAIDVAGGFLESRGIRNYLVDIGGEALAKGTKPGEQKWVIGIEQPIEAPSDERSLKATIKLQNEAVATSGNYRRFYEMDGLKYAHTIDPATGFPVQHSLLSATVFADSAGKADAYATAFMVMGTEKTLEFLKKSPHIDAYLIFSDKNGETKTFATTRVKKMLNER